MKNNAYKPLYESNVVGMQAKVKGTIGEKYLHHINSDYDNNYSNNTLEEDQKSNPFAYQSFTRSKVNQAEMKSAFGRLDGKRNSQMVRTSKNRPQTSMGGRNEMR